MLFPVEFRKIGTLLKTQNLAKKKPPGYIKLIYKPPTSTPSLQKIMINMSRPTRRIQITLKTPKMLYFFTVKISLSLHYIIF